MSAPTQDTDALDTLWAMPDFWGASSYLRARKPMPTPVNLSWWELATRVLLENKPTRVVLEPGDATRYQLILTPLVDEQVTPAFGIISKQSACQDFIMVTSVNGTNPAGVIVISRWSTYMNLVPIAPTEQWTRNVYAWWLGGFRQLWQSAHASRRAVDLFSPETETMLRDFDLATTARWRQREEDEDRRSREMQARCMQ